MLCGERAEQPKQNAVTDIASVRIGAHALCAVIDMDMDMYMLAYACTHGKVHERRSH